MSTQQNKMKSSIFQSVDREVSLHKMKHFFTEVFLRAWPMLMMNVNLQQRICKLQLNESNI